MANAEWFNLGALLVVAPASFGFGAVGLLLAAMWEFRGGNAFAATWETAFGCFWLFLGLHLAIFGPRIVDAAGPANASHAFGAYLLIWAVLTAGFTVGTWFVARPAFIAFALLVVVFLLLGAANIVTSADTSDTLRQIGGYLGIVDALIAYYLAFALMLNTLVARPVVPLWAYPYRK
jgi:uncharacterized protein